MSDEQSEAPIETMQAATATPPVPAMEPDPSIVGEYLQASAAPLEAKDGVRMVEEGGEAF